MTSAAFADDERYAHPDGQDMYGPRYEERAVPSQMRELLDSEGKYIIPSFIDRTIRRNNQECWIVDQIPAPGTILTCPQITTVELEYTCDGVNTFWAQLPIELLDVMPPEVTVVLDSNVQPHMSFGGVLRYLTPGVVVPVITASDTCDDAPATEYLLNGQPYVLGTPITTEGLHFLNVFAEDASGNPANAQVVFEIRQRPSHTAAAVVQSTDCEISPDGQTGYIDVTVMISDDQFDHRDILHSSMRLLLRGSDGSLLNRQLIPIDGGYIDGCEVYQHDTAEVDANLCWVAARFAGEFNPDPVTGCPAALEIIGVGSANGQLTFEWGARTVNVADPNAEQTLLTATGRQEPCGEPEPPVPPQPQPPCTSVETWFAGPSDDCQDIWSLPGMACTVTAKSRVTAHTKSIRGNGKVSVHNRNTVQWCSGSTQCSAQNVDFLLVNLAGDCCNCQITITATATVTAAANVNGSDIGGFWTATATSTGEMVFVTPCETDVAHAVASASKTNANVTSPPINDSQSDQAHVNCTVQACSSFLMVRPSGSFVGEAAALKNNQGIAADGYAEATGTINVWGYSDTVAWSATPCDPDNCDP